MTQGHDLAERDLHATELTRPGELRGPKREPGDEVELDGEALKGKPRPEPGVRRKAAPGLLCIAVDEDVLPGNEGTVENEDGVVLVEAARERVVEGAATVVAATSSYDARASSLTPGALIGAMKITENSGFWIGRATGATKL